MELKDLYSFVLVIVLVGLIIGIGVVIFDKFSNTPGVGETTNTTVKNMRTEVGNISSNWVGLIVTVSVLAIILVLVIRSFGSGRA